MSLHSQIDSHKIHEGYLYKKGVYNTSWRRRYFVLYDDRTMDYFKGKSHSTQRNKAKGTIHLTQIKHVEFVEYDDLNSNKNKSIAFKEVDDKENKSEISGVNGWSAVCNNNIVISSIDPPPEYNDRVLIETEQHFKRQREILSKSLTQLKCKQLNITNTIQQSMISPASSAAAELSDDGMFPMTLTPPNRSNVSSRTNSISYIDKQEISLTPRDEYAAFQIICRDTKSGLKCNKRYAFALISRSSTRIWILSAETNTNLKQWITVCSKLAQGSIVFNGYLNDNKQYFVLYKNKVLNCYKDCDLKHVEFDLDLRHILYLKHSTNALEIGLYNDNMDNIVLKTAEAYQWFEEIKSLFCDKLILKILYDSKVVSINIYHSGQHLKQRHIAMYRDYIVIFRDKQQLHRIKTMTFFSKTIFRDYARKQKCILIPLNANMKSRAASQNNGKYAFLISNADGDRKWYFNVPTKELLKKWLRLLSSQIMRASSRQKWSKHNNKNKKHIIVNNHCDIEVDSTFCNTANTPNSIKDNVSVISSDVSVN